MVAKLMLQRLGYQINAIANNGLDKGTFGHMDHIRLVVRADRVMYDCKIIRCKDGVMGVKFTSMPKPIAKVVR